MPKNPPFLGLKFLSHPKTTKKTAKFDTLQESMCSETRISVDPQSTWTSTWTKAMEIASLKGHKLPPGASMKVQSLWASLNVMMVILREVARSKTNISVILQMFLIGIVWRWFIKYVLVIVDCWLLIASWWFWCILYTSVLQTFLECFVNPQQQQRTVAENLWIPRTSSLNLTRHRVTGRVRPWLHWRIPLNGWGKNRYTLRSK